MPKEKRNSYSKGEKDTEKERWKPICKSEYDPIKIGSINGIGKFPHDNGIIRAMKSAYTPNAKIPDETTLSRTLFVANLAPSVSETEVEKLFAKYGSVEKVTLARDIVTKRSKGYGFVQFKRTRHFERAVKDNCELTLAGRSLIVDKTVSKLLRGWKPRRLGGGFGGTKDSGQLRFGCKAKPWLRPLFTSERRLRKSCNTNSGTN
jgi:U11/U12 small nuclear ribonucleoprotein SNRNP35